MKKTLIFVVFLLSLTACSNSSTDNDIENQFEIISTDINQVQVDEEYIFVLNVLSSDEIIDLLEAKSNSNLEVDILNNQGETKTSTTVFDFDIVRIIDTETEESKDIYIRVVSSFE